MTDIRLTRFWLPSKSKVSYMHWSVLLCPSWRLGLVKILHRPSCCSGNNVLTGTVPSEALRIMAVRCWFSGLLFTDISLEYGVYWYCGDKILFLNCWIICSWITWIFRDWSTLAPLPGIHWDALFIPCHGVHFAAIVFKIKNVGLG